MIKWLLAGPASGYPYSTGKGPCRSRLLIGPRVSIHAAAAACILACVPLFAADWVPIVKDLERRVPRVQIAQENGESGICSAVFINADTGYLVTAAHCVDGPGSSKIDVTVAGRNAAIVRSNRIIDLAVLRVEPNEHDVTCPLSKQTPPRGSEVAVAGYAFGFAQMPVQFGRMSLPYLRDDGTQLVNVDVVVGDSGGALIDSAGDLVGLIVAVKAAGPMHLSVAVPVETIRDYVSGYLPRAKP